MNFIIRAIDDILKTEFAIPTGLADHNRVTLLDFATGTGTFLLEAFERMFETIGEGKRDLLVREHILKNVFGFEYLIAPYTIAHLKLSQYLTDKGHKLAGNERLQIYLTNTLEPIEPQMNYLLPALSIEAEKAQEIKKRPILVIAGNPPYSGASKNKGAEAAKSIDAYKVVDGKRLNERKHWLNNDYIKFIRFAQMKIDSIEEGVVGIITSNSFLDGPTHRGMRQSLIKTFNKIYIIDLHGNSDKKERSPEGGRDENVFDINEGVSISVFVKTKRSESGVWRTNIWGDRVAKYETCARSNFKQIDWSVLKPASPWYYFVERSNVQQSEYNSFSSIKDIFPINVAGIITARDHLAIDFSPKELETKIEKFADPGLSVVDTKIAFKLEDSRGWKVEEAKKVLHDDSSWKKQILPISYRPFDNRYIVNDKKVVDWGRWDLMRHLLEKNIALSTIRKMDIVEQWTHVLAVQGLTTHHTVSMKEVNYAFPLYLYPKQGAQVAKVELFRSEATSDNTSVENISASFRGDLNTRYGTPYFTPEQVFGYIYAILHAPTYRTRYAEFLRGDFPRIPLTATRAAFEALSALGWDLAQKHLLKSVPANPVAYKGKGNNTVEKPRYAETEQAVYINATQSFAPVPEPAWNFHIGGYQVIDKYLKSRKGRTLTLDEVTNVEHIVAVLAFTITQMAAIDAAYQSAF